VSWIDDDFLLGFGVVYIVGRCQHRLHLQGRSLHGAKTQKNIIILTAVRTSNLTRILNYLHILHIILSPLHVGLTKFVSPQRFNFIKVRRIWMKSGTDVMPFDCCLISYHRQYEQGGRMDLWGGIDTIPLVTWSYNDVW
jgi:hypothetical protein